MFTGVLPEHLHLLREDRRERFDYLMAGLTLEILEPA
jgi:hypothetical protein